MTKPFRKDLITRDDLDRWGSCYEPHRLDVLHAEPLTPLQILAKRDTDAWNEVPYSDRLWVVLRRDVMFPGEIRNIACDFLEHAMSHLRTVPHFNSQWDRMITMQLYERAVAAARELVDLELANPVATLEQRHNEWAGVINKSNLADVFQIQLTEATKAGTQLRKELRQEMEHHKKEAERVPANRLDASPPAVPSDAPISEWCIQKPDALTELCVNFHYVCAEQMILHCCAEVTANPIKGGVHCNMAPISVRAKGILCTLDGSTRPEWSLYGQPCLVLRDARTNEEKWQVNHVIDLYS